MTHSAEKDALEAVRALADRWEAVLAECKAADPRWILDRSVTTLDTALNELRRVIPSGERDAQTGGQEVTRRGDCDE